MPLLTTHKSTRAQGMTIVLKFLRRAEMQMMIITIVDGFGKFTIVFSKSMLTEESSDVVKNVFIVIKVIF